MSAPDWFALIASERGAPEAWRWLSTVVQGESPHHAFILKGGVPDGVWRSGKNKGKPKWKRTAEVYVITGADLNERKLKWETETGKCAACGGEGAETVGVSVTEGRKTRPCRRCNGTGSANS